MASHEMVVRSGRQLDRAALSRLDFHLNLCEKSFFPILKLQGLVKYHILCLKINKMSVS